MSLTGTLGKPATPATQPASGRTATPVRAAGTGVARSAGSAWAVLAAAVALVPVAQGLTSSRIFYVRDLSLYFWGRYLWFRRALLSGSWPLWDPYVGAGQSAVADALHHVPPAGAGGAARGARGLGFNLWVLAPFPLAAWGAWLFFARRFPGPAAAVGAVAYALCGPIISTGDFPNMSWSVAALPWVLWTADPSWRLRRLAAWPRSHSRPPRRPLRASRSRCSRRFCSPGRTQRPRNPQSPGASRHRRGRPAAGD